MEEAISIRETCWLNRATEDLGWRVCNEKSSGPAGICDEHLIELKGGPPAALAPSWGSEYWLLSP